MYVKYASKPAVSVVRSMWHWVYKCRAVEVLGGLCVGENGTCGETNVQVLQFDHINSDGYLEGRRRGGSNLYIWVVAHPNEAKAKYQLLCARCHVLKTLDNMRGVA